MKVLSDIYTYSKDKSSAVFSSNSINESKKQKNKVDESSWFSKAWIPSSSISSSSSWFNKISLPKYKIPKYSFPSLSSFKLSIPKCSFPKFPLPSVWFKNVLIKLEESRVNCYLYIIELFKIIKKKSISLKLNYLDSLLNCSCLQFNSNPEYINLPWYKRVFLTTRDNVNTYISLYKGNVVSYIYKTNIEKENKKVEEVEEVEEEEEERNGEEEEINYNKKGSKAKLDRERSSRVNNSDDKYGMKHSQSSKYSNDLTTLRSSKKLKKTNTDDLKNSEDNETNINTDINTNANTNDSNIKHNRVFSMFSKTDIRNKSSHINDSLMNKYNSLYIGKNEDKIEDNNENKNITEVTNDESIPGSNETTTESTKFNIKKTWDKFSKIIS